MVGSCAEPGLRGRARGVDSRPVDTLAAIRPLVPVPPPLQVRGPAWSVRDRRAAARMLRQVLAAWRVAEQELGRLGDDQHEARPLLIRIAGLRLAHQALFAEVWRTTRER